MVIPLDYNCHKGNIFCNTVTAFYREKYENLVSRGQNTERLDNLSIKHLVQFVGVNFDRLHRSLAGVVVAPSPSLLNIKDKASRRSLIKKTLMIQRSHEFMILFANK